MNDGSLSLARMDVQLDLLSQLFTLTPAYEMPAGSVRLSDVTVFTIIEATRGSVRQDIGALTGSATLGSRRFGDTTRIVSNLYDPPAFGVRSLRVCALRFCSLLSSCCVSVSFCACHRFLRGVSL